MARPKYRNPPIHEVAFELRFSPEESNPWPILERMRASLSKEFDQTNTERSVTFTLPVGGAVAQAPSDALAGYSFSSTDRSWTCRIQPGLVALNLVRPGPWPRGPYLGWDEFREKLAKVHGVCLSALGGVSAERIGLRYINKIAVPLNENGGAKVDDWIQFGMEANDLNIGTTTGFNVQRAYQIDRDAVSFFAQLRLATIAIGEPDLRDGHLGILLDIDVWSQPPDAPTYAEVMPWSDVAHNVENVIFNSCLTDRMKEEFLPE